MRVIVRAPMRERVVDILSWLAEGAVLKRDSDRERAYVTNGRVAAIISWGECEWLLDRRAVQAVRKPLAAGFLSLRLTELGRAALTMFRVAPAERPLPDDLPSFIAEAAELGESRSN